VDRKTSRRYYHQEKELHILLSHCHFYSHQHHPDLTVCAVSEVTLSLDKSVDKDKDLSFLCEKELEQVCFGWASIQLHFSSEISLFIECTFEHVAKDGQAVLGDSSKPISCSSLLALLVSSVKRVDNIGEGTIELFFSNGDRVRVYDSNDSTKSYNITFPEGMIIV
jgi:hypothetical protein